MSFRTFYYGKLFSLPLEAKSNQFLADMSNDSLPNILVYYCTNKSQSLLPISSQPISISPSGFAPFAGESDLDTLDLVQHGELEFPSPEWDEISSEAKDFITKLLDRDPERRPTADEALHHPWIAKYVLVKPGIPKPKPFHRRGVSESTVISMKSDRRYAFQKLLNGVKIEKNLKRVASLLTPAEAGFLARVFRKVDKDNDGRITTHDIDAAIEAGSLTGSVQDNLKELQSALRHTTRKSSFDVTPFIQMAEEKSVELTLDK